MKKIKLYNMILPPFMLFAFVPVFWIISIVGNFIIDSVALLVLSLIVYKNLNWQFYKKVIFRVWLLGFIADFFGIAYLLIISLTTNAEYYEGGDLGKQILSGIYLATNHSHFDSIWGVVFIVSGILVSALFIFIFNYFVSFYNTEFKKKQKLMSALYFAIFTAPYTFLLPKELFY